MMRLKDVLSLGLAIFGLITPILYFLGLFYNVGWEAYWGIPQVLFELDFHTVIFTGAIFILEVLLCPSVILFVVTNSAPHCPDQFTQKLR